MRDKYWYFKSTPKQKRYVNKPKRVYEYDFDILEDKGYEYYYKYLKKYMYSKYRHFDDDIIQTTLITICKKNIEYDESMSKKETFLCTILHNNILQKSRVNKLYKLVSIDDEQRDGLTYVDVLPYDDTIYEENNYTTLLMNEININEDFFLIKSRVFEQLSYEELCTKYDKPMWWVKKTLRDQRKQLKEKRPN